MTRRSLTLSSESRARRDPGFAPWVLLFRVLPPACGSRRSEEPVNFDPPGRGDSTDDTQPRRGPRYAPSDTHFSNARRSVTTQPRVATQGVHGRELGQNARRCRPHQRMEVRHSTTGVRIARSIETAELERDRHGTRGRDVAPSPSYPASDLRQASFRDRDDNGGLLQKTTTRLRSRNLEDRDGH